MKRLRIHEITPEALSVVYRRRLKRRKRIRQTERSLFLLISFFALFCYLTNPFTKFSVIRDPVTIRTDGNQFTFLSERKLYVIDNQVARTAAAFKSMWHILTNRLSGGVQAPKTTLEGIIDNIHALRFNPDSPYLISGDHFSLLYPRSLGIFYHSTLDPRTARSKQDWIHRQQIYLKTVLYALDTYQHTDRLSTTIVPIGPESVTVVNYFSPPSDTMYSLLYGLSTLLSTEELTRVYRYDRQDNEQYTLDTVMSAKEALIVYRNVLTRQLGTYVTMVTDPATGLIRKDITLSSTKDSVLRSSSFYDNVILWKTHQLAQTLGVEPHNPQQLTALKETILKTFWLPREGYFLEQLSDKAIAEKHYSSDWLIAFITGFLDPKNETEREYFTRSVSFIQKEKLDRPFALFLSPKGQNERLHWLLRAVAPAYGTHAIWSFWGMEYTNLLTSLYQSTCNESYAQEANYQIDAYAKNIVEHRGYPEVYAASGNPYQTVLYSSVEQTGWVVGFEQARAMLEFTKKNTSDFCPITEQYYQNKTERNIRPS